MYELDRLNEINEFFELPFAKEYIRNNDTLIRQMLALLNGIEEGETVNQLQSDALKETARRLLRSSELAMSLVDEHKCCDGKAVDLADYLTRFVKKCAWVLPERLEIEAVILRKDGLLLMKKHLIVSFLDLSAMLSDGLQMKKQNYRLKEISVMMRIIIYI